MSVSHDFECRDLYDYECRDLYVYECGQLYDYKCWDLYDDERRSYDDECVAEIFECPIFLG